MSDLYIPPDGVKFRLKNFAHEYVLAATSPPKGGSLEPEHEDHWWTLETTPNPGKYFIKSTGGTNAGQVLRAWDGGVHMAEKHLAEHQGNYFIIEPGTGDFLGQFRIRTETRHEELVIGILSDKRVWLRNISRPKEPYLFFSFLFEKTTIHHIEWDTKNGTKLETIDLTVTDTVENERDTSIKQTANLTKRASETSSFEESHGFTITIGATATFGIPGIADGEIKTEVSTAHDYKWGSSHTEEKEVGHSVELDVPPHSQQEVVGTIKSTRIKVPCTIYSQTDSGVMVVTSSIYEGKSLWGFDWVVKKPKPWP